MKGVTWAIRSEWTKLRSLSSTGWLILLTIAGTVGLASAITGSLDYQHCYEPCTVDPTKLSLAGVRLGQIGVMVLAVLAVTAEYSTRNIQPTLMATPQRIQVMLGKLTVVSMVGLAAGTVAVAISLVAGRNILPGNGFTAAHGFPLISLTDGLTRRAAIGTVVYIGLIAVLGAGLGLLFRDTAGALTAALALLYGSPIVAMFVSNPIWQQRLHRYSPMDAGLVIQSTRNLAAEAIGPWSGLGVLAAYAGTAVLAGLLVFQVRDAR
jgi:ABC-2 type transport system permease protein